VGLCASRFLRGLPRSWGGLSVGGLEERREGGFIPDRVVVASCAIVSFICLSVAERW
jgi:hypothetical protein